MSRQYLINYNIEQQRNNIEQQIDYIEQQRNYIEQQINNLNNVVSFTDCIRNVVPLLFLCCLCCWLLEDGARRPPSY